MHAYIVRIITLCRFMLLMLGSKARVFLNNGCWFNAVSELEKDTSIYSDSLDSECMANWIKLWHSAGRLYHGLYHPNASLLKALPVEMRPRRLAVRKRYELAFLFRISSLHQLMMCLHASGDSGDAAMQVSLRPQSTMRCSAIVLFLLPSFSLMRS